MKGPEQFWEQLGNCRRVIKSASHVQRVNCSPDASLESLSSLEVHVVTEDRRSQRWDRLTGGAASRYSAVLWPALHDWVSPPSLMLWFLISLPYLLFMFLFSGVFLVLLPLLLRSCFCIKPS